MRWRAALLKRRNACRPARNPELHRPRDPARAERTGSRGVDGHKRDDPRLLRSSAMTSKLRLAVIGLAAAGAIGLGATTASAQSPGIYFGFGMPGPYYSDYGYRPYYPAPRPYYAPRPR